MRPAASPDARGAALLVVQTSFLGDVVLTTPLVSALRRRLAPRRLALLVRPDAVPLVAGHPDVDQVLVDDKRGADRGALGWLRTARRLRAERFEVAVSPPGPGPLVGVAPGSVWATKRWTPEGYAAVISALVAEGARCVLLGAPGEAALAREIDRRAGGGATVLAGRTDLATMVAVIDRLA